MLTIPPNTKLWFAAVVDLRLGFDGLANLVPSQLDADHIPLHRRPASWPAPECGSRDRPWVTG